MTRILDKELANGLTQWRIIGPVSPYAKGNESTNGLA
jgi:hypothetical protein